MERVRLGKTSLMVSRVGLGGIPIMRLNKEEAIKVVQKALDLGINFIDTAREYGDSEEKIGQAIKGRKREEILISSKSPAPDKKTFLEHLDLSLEKLGTDYIDIYHLHGVNSKEEMRRVMSEGGAYQGIVEAIRKGKIKHSGFSSHNLTVGEELMLINKFEVVQMGLNFVDNESEKKIVPLARKLDMGFIAMKPLGGGLLEDAEIAIRYLLQFEGVVPIPGVEKFEEIKQIVQIAKNPRPLTSGERVKMERTRRELGKEFCHRCDYCQPCPQEIPISTVLTLKSMVKRFSLENILRNHEANVARARKCTECEECVERCPYNLSIPQLLKKNIAYFEKLKNEAEVKES